ncbi:MAG: hypothetical protein JO277_14385 [Candidatus Eremiobacteraeota bacterium]|nr:hypothetical protein [Candidatus Eremiobacteraeota bacterium]
MADRRRYVVIDPSRAGAVAIVSIFVTLVCALPGRYQLVPQWVILGDAILLVAALLAALFTPSLSPARRFEHRAALAAVGIAVAIVCIELTNILRLLAFAPNSLKPFPLFQTSIALWVANALVFTMAYWLLDGGGPDRRASGSAKYFDLDFPARSDPGKVPPGWQPTIVDYLFVAFTANTSFGPTEAMPLTQAAKSLVMLQALISLITIAVVAARAIGATG